jgi:hypothetical protein
LKVTFRSLVIASKGNLWYLFFELLQDLLVDDIALLIVLMHDEASFVADSGDVSRHQRSASIVAVADVTVDAFPARVAVASRPVPRRALVAQRQRST